MVTGKPHRPTLFARFVLYPLAGALFLVLLTIILILANGYRFTYSNGQVGLTKTGMLIVTTRPFDALVSLNGKATKYRTSFYLLQTKISSLQPGFYDVEISKNGYRTWKDRLEIKPNMVTWANYVLLFPNKLNVSKIDVPVGSVVGKSENGRHLLYAGTADGSFSLKSLDSNNLSVKNFWPSTTPSEAWLTSPQITAASFSSNYDRVLLSVANGTRTEYVIVDASGSEQRLVHLNTELNQDFSEISWSLTNNNDLYVLTTAGLSLVTLSNTTVSINSPMLTNVVSYKLDDGRQIFYVTQDQDEVYTVGKMGLDGGNKTVITEGIAPAKSYRFDFSNQNSVLTVLNTDSGDLTAYYSGTSGKNSSLKLSSSVTSFSWSKDGQKLFYCGKDFIKRYDWEKNKEVSVTLTEAPLGAQWFFDENHYLIVDAKGVSVMDYDGSNIVSISESPVEAYALDTSNSNIIYSSKDAEEAVTFYKYIAEF